MTHQQSKITPSWRLLERTKDRIVAIKTVQRKTLSSSSKENLLVEIQLLKRLNHKYIVNMFDFVYDEQNVFIIMEYCEGGNLSLYIRKHKTLPEKTCKFFLGQLAEAVQYMHSQNVSHFDLKPQNLLLTYCPNLTLKVADFGFAQYLDMGESNSTLKGSPLYMAPEILLDRCYDQSADLWSIGVILYECLFGSAPYSSKSIEELMDKIQKKKKIEIPKTKTITSTCEDLLARLLVHDPKQRISFTNFFEHEFLNLRYKDNDEKLKRAVDMFRQAVEEDSKLNYSIALQWYSKGLQEFLQIIFNEPNSKRKAALRERANVYLQRAEEIKDYCSQSTSVEQTKPVAGSTQSSETAGQSVQRDSDNKKPLTAFTYIKLHQMCTSSQSLLSALEIGRQGELYAFEKNYRLALENLTGSLSILIPLIQQEPPGTRREMLHAMTNKWMREAEQLKAHIEKEESENASEMPSHHACCVQ
ncbi:serine/threonine-protein kinase ULK3-like isoform X2 [Bradysia coprophila]|uniref:serine/threonine-protein kinase ULK3-like isoform X2 n=1 Tax=Bradysia coprophila TaxID=38358 RepID=UPI00187DA5BD|nr:serine/threonine-protein kinase ULK3-like isoform X2 [Bradysia coprophila]